MTDPRTSKFRAVLKSVNEVLYNEWAPIGFVGGLPKDEYESYAMHVISLLSSGATEAELASYLALTGESILGTPIAVESVQGVARRLIEFREDARAIAL